MNRDFSSGSTGNPDGRAKAGAGSGEVTVILESIAQGDDEAAERLLPVVYDELRRLAGRQMTRERANHTLQPTALVHEACLRLLGNASAWSNRRRFFSAAAEAMRRILIDHARKRSRQRHGGGWKRIELADAEAEQLEKSFDLVVLDDALRRMEQQDARMAAVVKLRFFGGLSVRETAETLEISEGTVKREWACARAWLYDAVYGDRDEDVPGASR